MDNAHVTIVEPYKPRPNHDLDDHEWKDISLNYADSVWQLPPGWGFHDIWVSMKDKPERLEWSYGSECRWNTANKKANPLKDCGDCKVGGWSGPAAKVLECYRGWEHDRVSILYLLLTERDG